MNTPSTDLPSSPIRLPEWQATEWLNTAEPLSLAALRGKVVLLHAFQMLCPGCVSHALPQAERTRQAFPDSDFAVVGLHTVFEHHDVMGAQALRAFVQEYRWRFPIGIDLASPDDPVPRTMRAWGLRGTPTHIVLDRQGFVRLNHFGRIDDLALGGLIGRLLADPRPAVDAGSDASPVTSPVGCDADVCPAPAPRQAG